MPNMRCDARSIAPVTHQLAPPLPLALGRRIRTPRGLRKPLQHAIRSESHQRSQSQVLTARRNMLLATGATALSPCIPGVPAFAEQRSSGSFKTVVDEQLAYTFEYPETTLKGAPLKWYMSRKPEKYSSAAPMSADARQRIVTELLDFSGPFIMSVVVGPKPVLYEDTPVEEWDPETLALAVLAEKSTGRVTTGQRITLNAVEDAKTTVVGDTRYWTYEHLAQGSPNSNLPTSKETYRHALGVTALRGDYLYTLNLVAPESNWEEMAPLYEQAQASFRLTEPTRKFVPPEKDPWKFW